MYDLNDRFINDVTSSDDEVPIYNIPEFNKNTSSESDNSGFEDDDMFCELIN